MTDQMFPVMTLISERQRAEFLTGGQRVRFRMTKALRFWVDVEYERIRNHCPGHSRTELLSQILRAFEAAGDAMRYLDVDGRVAWKATPGMLSRLADAEQEAIDDMEDWP
jgi:hypothetical protein